MELDEFVETTLTQILSGVAKAKEKFPSQVGISTKLPKGSVGVAEDSTGWTAFLVEFDVEVAASAKGGGKLSVGWTAIGAGVGGEASKESAHTNRIKFGVPIHYSKTR
jgi:hypothetical protein